VPIVIGALGVDAAGFVDRLKLLGLRDVVGSCRGRFLYQLLQFSGWC
jgi:hypothetical protein